MTTTTNALLLLAIPCAVLAGCLGHDDCTEGEVRCDGNVAQTCFAEESSDGYENRWASHPCGQQVCNVIGAASGKPQALCALASAPDARCLDADVPNCAGETLVSCTAGYATAERPCDSGCLALDDHADRCREDADGDSLCRFASAQSFCEGEDPFMVTAGHAPDAVCMDNQPVLTSPPARIYTIRCEGGRLVERTRCASSCDSSADCSAHCH